MNPTFMAEFAERLDEQRLDKALLLLLSAEPVLGCRLVAEGSPRWQPIEDLPDSVLTVTDEETEYDRLSSESPDVYYGPQISAVLWRKPERDLLLLRICHECGDGMAVQYCFERLAEIYTGLANDAAYVPSVSTGTRDTDRITKHLPKSSFFGIVRDWASLALDAIVSRKTLSLTLPSEPNEPRRYVIREIPVFRVTALSEYCRAHGATLNDLFLAAFYRSLVKQENWDRKSSLRILCAVDLRTWYLANPQPNAVANMFSSEFPFLGRTLGSDFTDTLRRVSSVMKRRKRRNPGLAAFLLIPKVGRGISKQRVRRAQKLATGSGVPGFSNLGRLHEERFFFAGQTPIEAAFLAPKVRLPKLSVGLSGYRGALTLSSSAADSARPQIEAFLDGMLAELPV